VGSGEARWEHFQESLPCSVTPGTLNSPTISCDNTRIGELTQHSVPGVFLAAGHRGTSFLTRVQIPDPSRGKQVISIECVACTYSGAR
jgi:hypothetical protein